jgi:hypothetical protein
MDWNQVSEINCAQSFNSCKIVVCGGCAIVLNVFEEHNYYMKQGGNRNESQRVAGINSEKPTLLKKACVTPFTGTGGDRKRYCILYVLTYDRTSNSLCGPTVQY